MDWECVIHFGGGFIVGILSPYYPVLSILLTTLFIFYELDEQWHLKDESFKDIKEYLLGGFTAAILMAFYIIFDLLTMFL